jgi:hypothetical protein
MRAQPAGCRSEIPLRYGNSNGMNIEELPDFPAIRQLGDALWHHGPTRGAAALVGAGFSRGAERPGADTPLPPLWENIAGEMRRRTGPETPDPSSTDPLRLAEEYRASYGQASLDGLIRALIRDEAWTPSQLHTGLLELPWSDVLTTNWDIPRLCENPGSGLLNGARWVLVGA